MSVHVALLRAVNVGGTGKLPMVELVAMCEDAGFTDVRTYIASGNVVFRSGLGEAGVRKALGQRLQAYAGKPVGVWVRAWRWHYLLGPIKKIPTKTMFPITTIGYMGNNIYPAHAVEDALHNDGRQRS